MWKPSDPASSPSRPGSAIAITLAVLAAGTAVGIAAVSLSSAARSMSPSAPLARQPVAPSASEVASLLHRLGFSPHGLAAAGVGPGQTTALVGNLRGFLETSIDALRSADSNVAAASRLADSLERLARAGTASPEQLQSLAAARTQLASHTAARQALLDQASHAATAALDAGAVQALALAREHSSAGWGGTAALDIPLPYAFADRPDEEWVHLRDALSNRRLAARHGLPPSPEALDGIARADAHPAVATARANLDTLLAPVQAAWDDAVGR